MTQDVNDELKQRLAEAMQYHQAGKLGDAERIYRQILAVDGRHAEALHLLGVIAHQVGRNDVAVELISKAIGLSDKAAFHSNLGLALQGLGRLDEAATAYSAAVRLKPDFAEAHSNLGNALKDLGRLDEAIASYGAALRIKSDFAEAHCNLGAVLKDAGRFEEAVAACTAATRIKPNYAEAHSNLGAVLSDLGYLDDAVAAYNTAIHLKPDFVKAHSNLLMCLHYRAGVAGDLILGVARRFGAVFDPAPKPASYVNPPVPARRLRIGYVSGDFRRHPVGYFLNRVLSSHDPAAVEIFCYSNDARFDDLSAQLREAADHWRTLVGMSDDAAAALVAADGIDILIDLSGHTAGNRLPMFARKPAPVQVSWLGYFGTTGLSAMDYILADRFVAPERLVPEFTEKVCRLPESYLCFSPPDLDCPVVSPPVTRGEAITFGNFNNHSKTSPLAIDLWARLLGRVPGSRLFLKAQGLGTETGRQRLIARFAEKGIGADRLLLEGASLRADLLGSYNRVDIALDPMPYGGGTTTAEALWMGVPVVTLRGETWVGRVSESILSTVGVPGLVASSPEEYVDIAAELALDTNRLQVLRSTLRSQLEASVFCDGPRFTRELENAYRGMWHKWCGR